MLSNLFSIIEINHENPHGFKANCILKLGSKLYREPISVPDPLCQVMNVLRQGHQWWMALQLMEQMHSSKVLANEAGWLVVSNIPWNFHTYLGKFPIWTNIFDMGWFNH